MAIESTLRPSHSGWSIATTTVESELLSPLEAPLTSDSPSTPACWRLHDVRRINRVGDMDSISRLLRFRPFTDDFELKPHIPTRDSAYETPYSPWTWKPYESRDLSAENISEALAWESMKRILEIPFEDWVRHALGLAPISVENLERGYIELGCRLFYYLRRNKAQETKYQTVQKVGFCLYGCDLG
ncbi:hypothetical protein ASPCAL12644 [Aspergillus calidoustus]|uniref:Uncharacterized protein n=1 Tax=Aspergillus calidoustus TaxID=454130 RepID=A0A0U4ZIZ6_ASPCI|nr:hypothetical protein ASPCAL12644 [Aspergillus calidoustus]